jgi:predicted  nucleic acid-binding Zn-ribbon protein
MTKAQQIYERVEALVAGGSTKAAAYEAVAKELGLKPNSVRGAYYQHTRKQNGAKRQTRVRETTIEGAVASATASLEKALTDIDLEIEAAKERADEAKGEFEALKASAAERKQAITAKIEALS